MREADMPIIPKLHTVLEGESLAAIARRYTGTFDEWVRLYNCNKEIIGSNPSRLAAGTVITLPREWLA